MLRGPADHQRYTAILLLSSDFGTDGFGGGQIIRTEQRFFVCLARFSLEDPFGRQNIRSKQHSFLIVLGVLLVSVLFLCGLVWGFVAGKITRGTHVEVSLQQLTACSQTLNPTYWYLKKKQYAGLNTQQLDKMLTGVYDRIPVNDVISLMCVQEQQQSPHAASSPVRRGNPLGRSPLSIASMKGWEGRRPSHHAPSSSMGSIRSPSQASDRLLLNQVHCLSHRLPICSPVSFHLSVHFVCRLVCVCLPERPAA